MVYVDGYSQSALGEKIGSGGNVESYIASGVVTKGMVLKFVAVAYSGTELTGYLPTVEECGAADAWPAGVALNAAAIGKAVSVARKGCVVKVRADGVIAWGVQVKCGASGCVKTIAGDTMGLVIGRALQVATTAGDDILIEVGDF